MTTNQKGIYAAICMILFAAVMGTAHFLIRGINEQFGAGFAVGMLFMAGCIFLASRDARHIP